MITAYWCAGMYASGSTWAYNVMRGIAACGHPGHTVKGRFVNVLADLAGLGDAAFVHVVKSHDMAPDIAAALSRLATSIVVTIRDPRDAVTSLMMYQRYPFELALTTIKNSGNFVAGVASDPRALLLRYETGFTDDAATLDRIAEWFGVTLPAADRDRLFAQHRRTAVEGFVATLENLPQAKRDARSGDIFDPESQWHRHHAGRSGEVGRWRRMLMPGQVAAIEREMREWMARFDYQPAPLFAPAYTLNVGTFSVKLS
jgi:transcriptional regulator with XRE-family HTH domain